MYEGFDHSRNIRVALKVMDVSNSQGQVTVPLQAVKREIRYAVGRLPELAHLRTVAPSSRLLTARVVVSIWPVTRLVAWRGAD